MLDLMFYNKMKNKKFYVVPIYKSDTMCLSMRHETKLYKDLINFITQHKIHCRLGIAEYIYDNIDDDGVHERLEYVIFNDLKDLSLLKMNSSLNPFLLNPFFVITKNTPYQNEEDNINNYNFIKNIFSDKNLTHVISTEVVE